MIVIVTVIAMAEQSQQPIDAHAGTYIGTCISGGAAVAIVVVIAMTLRRMFESIERQSGREGCHGLFGVRSVE